MYAPKFIKYFSTYIMIYLMNNKKKLTSKNGPKRIY